VPRYYFHLYSHAVCFADEEGIGLKSLAEVRAAALKGARSIISQDVLEGRIDLDGRIEVVDEAGDLVLVQAFRDAAGSGDD
jgi:hypothetical protein